MYKVTLVCFVLVAMVATAQAIKCYTGGKSSAGKAMVSTDCNIAMPTAKKCVATNTKGVVAYMCALNDGVCDINKDGVKSCCCDTDNCNDEKFGKACSSGSVLNRISMLSFIPMVAAIVVFWS